MSVMGGHHRSEAIYPEATCSTILLDHIIRAQQRYGRKLDAERASDKNNNR